MSKRVSWVRAALKNFGKFPHTVQQEMARALTLAAAGERPESAEPLKGLGPGVLEFRESSSGGSDRALYAVKIGDELWVLHAFQKKAKTGITTPQAEMDLASERLKRLKEELK